jgi:hypothetical protein
MYPPIGPPGSAYWYPPDYYPGPYRPRFRECWTDCVRTMLLGHPMEASICSGGLTLASRIAAASSAPTLAGMLAALPTWAGMAGFGCAIGCGLAEGG